MMARKGGLGRGLEALIPGSEPLPAEGILSIPADRISPNPRQPRSHFDPSEMAELTASIREHGVLQPLIVTIDVNREDHYVLIAGERRLVAARQAGLETVPAILREADEQQRLELALVENVQRADLNPLEAAEAYRQLVEDFGLTHEEISAQVGKSRSAISNTLRLLSLPAEIRQALVDGRISEGHARALLMLQKSQTQLLALRTILNHELNVRQTEEMVHRLSGESLSRLPAPAQPPEIMALEERLRARLGTKVFLKSRRKKGGSITIHYYSDEELDALLEILLGEE